MLPYLDEASRQVEVVLDGGHLHGPQKRRTQRDRKGFDDNRDRGIPKASTKFLVRLGRKRSALLEIDERFRVILI